MAQPPAHGGSWSTKSQFRITAARRYALKQPVAAFSSQREPLVRCCEGLPPNARAHAAWFSAHFDVQIWGGIALFHGRIAGWTQVSKTLTATFPCISTLVSREF
jgi:hypothetical protein